MNEATALVLVQLERIDPDPDRVALRHALAERGCPAWGLIPLIARHVVPVQAVRDLAQKWEDEDEEHGRYWAGRIGIDAAGELRDLIGDPRA